MTKGRKPLPQEILDLRGTSRKDRLRPSSTIGEIIKPEEVGDKCQVSGLRSATKRARDIYWSRVKMVATQGMLEEAFLGQLLIYAVEFDHFMTCCESIRRDGLFLPVVDNNGRTIMIPNPAVKQRDVAIDKIIRIGSNFGFSPVDRQKLKAQFEQPKEQKLKAMFAAVFEDGDDDPEEQ